MLFDEPTAAHIGGLWTGVSEAGSSRGNLWDESWEAPLDGLFACYAAAEKTQSPEAWRAVAVQGRKLREALEHNDGTEHRLYVAVTRLTDAIETGMDALARKGQGLVTREEVETFDANVQSVEQAAAEDPAKRTIFGGEKRRALDELTAMVAEARTAIAELKEMAAKSNGARIHVEVKPAVIDTGLGDVAQLIAELLKFIQSHELAEQIKQAAGRLKEAGGKFYREVRARFDAFKLPWQRTPAEDYLTGQGGKAGIVILVRDGKKDREERRVPEPAWRFRIAGWTGGEIAFAARRWWWRRPAYPCRAAHS